MDLMKWTYLAFLLAISCEVCFSHRVIIHKENQVPTPEEARPEGPNIGGSLLRIWRWPFHGDKIIPVNGNNEKQVSLPLNGKEKQDSLPLNDKEKQDSLPLNGNVKQDSLQLNDKIKVESLPLNGKVKQDSLQLNDKIKVDSLPLNGKVKQDSLQLNDKIKVDSLPLNGKVKQDSQQLNGKIKVDSLPLNGKVKQDSLPVTIAYEPIPKSKAENINVEEIYGTYHIQEHKINQEEEKNVEATPPAS